MRFKAFLLCLFSVFLFAAGARSSQWPKARNTYIALHPRCEACGTLQGCQVHHIIPVHVDASKELDQTNLITLCKKGCHLKIGHGGSYKFYNPNSRIDAKLAASNYPLAVEISRQARIKMAK